MNINHKKTESTIFMKDRGFT